MFNNFFKKLETPVNTNESNESSGSDKIVDREYTKQEDTIKTLNETILMTEKDLVVDSHKTFELKNLWKKIEEKLPKDIGEKSKEEQIAIVNDIRATLEN